MYKTEKEQRKELSSKLYFLIFAVGILLSIGTFAYHFSEGWGWLDSLYFATISLTARGFSEQHPSNWFSVLFSIFYLLIGVALLIYTLSTFIAYYSSFYQQKIEKNVSRFVDNVKGKNKDKKEKWVMLRPK